MEIPQSAALPALNLKTVELKAFLPAQDYALSQAFYQDLGFTMAWDGGDLAYFHHENVSFLLQNFYVKEFAENLMMHLLVEDVDAWWSTLQASGLIDKYAVRTVPPQDQPWGMRDFVIIDPSGVLWRIAQNTD
ncbi:hypothetical protein IGB42_00154 [Andreprevotia sp. IGB-42]|uniref:VOC family protein n=1 Tax=Andreprevotia sp. IGB-42 TaxID=2497473 RepID=UPI001359B63A|nr:VOC family protein [Andreprevotia sp. IGB-42]KAF0815077.1 hypothetical protein IGB42_00154 [Andreprevotia sp. IGB-42]